MWHGLGSSPSGSTPIRDSPPSPPTYFALVSFAHADGNDATDDLVDRINGDGRFYITASEAGGQSYARISIGSTWTTQDDVDALWQFITAHA